MSSNAFPRLRGFPRIIEACELIALDNGGKVYELYGRADHFLIQYNGPRIEAALEQLRPVQRDLMCCGEVGEIEALCLGYEDRQYTSEFLNKVFDDVGGPRWLSAPPPPSGWTCFHCGEHFTEYSEAAKHFGMDGYPCDPQLPPECLDAASPARKLARRARVAEAGQADAKARATAAEETADSYRLQLAELRSRYGVGSVHDAWAKFDSLEGRVLAAELTLRVIEARYPNVVMRARAALEKGQTL